MGGDEHIVGVGPRRQFLCVEQATKVGDEYVEEILPEVEVKLVYKDYSEQGESKAMAMAENSGND